MPMSPGRARSVGEGLLSERAFICRVFFTCALYLCFLCVYRVRQNKPGSFIFRSKYLSLHRAFFCTAVWRGVAMALRRGRGDVVVGVRVAAWQRGLCCGR